MGAGLAGLSCTKYLEDNNITPVIFKKRHRVGERFPNMEAIIQLVHRPFKDPLLHINKTYNDCLTLRKYANTMDNEDFDKLVSFLNLPKVSNILSNTNIPAISMAAKAIRSTNFMRNNKN